MKLKFSIIIPVFNRPDEIDELLQSLCFQTFDEFEVIVIDDGSEKKCDKVCNEYLSRLNLSYFYKSNSGPGLTRNFGVDKSQGNYFVFFDSDCIIPYNYMETVMSKMLLDYADCYGGPDRAHPDFSNIQKAINYSMTSFFTTGGIRGGKKKLDRFYPRSFNMGFSKEVFVKTGGFSHMRFGEDIDLSLRIIENSFKTVFIENAYVFHKRRTGLFKFYKQVFNSGIARINLYKRHNHSLRLVHLLPAVFVVFNILLILFSFINVFFLLPFISYFFLIFFDSLMKSKNMHVAWLAIFSSAIQIFGYGFGFIIAVWKRIILRGNEFNAFTKKFY